MTSNTSIESVRDQAYQCRVGSWFNSTAPGTLPTCTSHVCAHVVGVYFKLTLSSLCISLSLSTQSLFTPLDVGPLNSCNGLHSLHSPHTVSTDCR